MGQRRGDAAYGRVTGLSLRWLLHFITVTDRRLPSDLNVRVPDCRHDRAQCRSDYFRIRRSVAAF
jgi:hypothetical protein